MSGMLTAAWAALGNIADPLRLVMLTAGVLGGLVLGIVPGLGGLVGLTLLLPFTYHMDPYTALAMLIGMHAVVATSDAIPAVLFGVPGSVGSAATVLDGFPMAKRGEAGRALGASFAASLVGGLFGALLLAATLPVIRPALLFVGAPEMLAFCVFGLSLAAALSGRYMLRGLAVACFGLLLSMVGEDYQSGTLRWTFGSIYLWEGIPIVPFALGLFAIPEIADLVVRRTAIAGKEPMSTRGQWDGIKDVLRNLGTVMRSSTIGSIMGAVPGLGSAVIDWIAYGSAAKSVKGASDTFGKGDVRGVIASEAANNAKEGGALVPTLAFGVPGSAGMAILLGAFLMQGIVPGPDMLGKHLDVTYTMIWSLAVANLMGAAICFAFAHRMAKIALIPIGYLAPVILAITFVGAFQGSNDWGDIFVLFGAGAVGYLMRSLQWPRPPLLLGFVLGTLIERYLFTSIQIYGLGLFARPLVIATLVVTAWGLLAPVAGIFLRRRGRPPRKLAFGFLPGRLGWDTLFAGAALALLVVALADMWRWPFGARIIPEIVSFAGILFLAGYLATRLFVEVKSAEPEPVGADMDLGISHEDLTLPVIVRRSLVYFAWLGLYLVIAALIGPLPALFVWMLACMIVEFRMKWLPSLATAAATWGLSYLLFIRVLHVPWPKGLFGL
ncbi:tripartite tricarboxylate transporter permease [Propylenella binzhouense]|uniref:DUF112 domain-containing protein n=1 Tax=Propylenella binzhouense TaxID=2555902 RepID=A0A964T375_9HYPH|nr:tripartite tricarboxylate transporter permease [Propylenella binzhouense]MYZ47117.1 hypothetical protein [Propylenella binzhouense]